MVAIGVPSESQDEPRIGLTPETVKKLVKAGACHAALGCGPQVAFLRR